MSKLTLGQQLTLFASNPSKSSCSVAFMFGSVSPFLYNWTIAYGSSTPAPKKPLGLWYLKLLPTKWTPFAINAEAKVSPSKP